MPTWVGVTEKMTSTAQLRGISAWVVGVCLTCAVLLGGAVVVMDWRVLVLGALALALVLTAFRYPLGGVLCYVMVAVFRPEELRLAPAYFRFGWIFAITCMLSLALPRVVAGHWRRWAWCGTDGACVALLSAAALSVPLSVSRPTALAACSELAKLVFAYILIRCVATSPRAVRAVVWTLVVASMLTGVLAFRGAKTGHLYVGESGLLRVTGLTSTAGDPDTLANTLVASIPLIVALLLSERRWVARLLLGATGVFCLYVDSLTGTRGAAVSLGVVVVLLILSSRRRLLLAAVLPGCLLLLWMRLSPDLKARYLTLRDYQQQVTYRGRVSNLKVGIRMCLDHPIGGVGIGCYEIARKEQYDGVWTNVHNVYAQVASETGLPGSVAFVVFVASVFLTAFRARRRLRTAEVDRQERHALEQICGCIAVMVVCLLVQGLTSHNLLRWNYYLGAAVVSSCLAIANERRATSAEQAVTGESEAVAS